MYKLSIIIVNYNVKEFILNLLQSINSAAKNISYEVIIVDNASDDGSVEIIKEKFPSVNLIVNTKNVGFGKANNQALTNAKGDFILLINPDTIVREDTFDRMFAFFESMPEAGMAGCKVLNPDGTLQLACRRSFPGPWTSFTKVVGLSTLFPKSKLFAKYNLTYLDENKTYEVDAISGSFMMLRKEVYAKIGGFDPEFFMYGEDLDLCYRVQKSGFKVFYVHSTEIIHYKGESTKRSSLDETKVFYDAMHLFVKKHFSSSFIVEYILRLAIFIRKLIATVNIYKLPLFTAFVDYIFFTTTLFISEKIYAKDDGWQGFPDEVKPFIYFIPGLLQLFISTIFTAYKKKSISVLRIVISLLAGVVLISSLTFFFKQYAFSRAVLLITYAILIFLLPLWRIFAKLFFNVGIEKHLSKAKTLIVGTENRALDLTKKLKSNVNDIHNIIGLIGFKNDEIDKDINGIKVIGTINNIKKVIDDKKIDKVIFSSDKISYAEIFRIVSLGQSSNVDFMIAGTESDYLVGKSAIAMLNDIPLVKVHYNISSISNKIVKLIFDVSLSLLILFFIFPFVYLFSRKKKPISDLQNFILNIPKVFSLDKSLVGPKAESSAGLFLGKPGLTGLWFTEFYDYKDLKEEEKLNIYYAKNQNAWLDLEILGKTISKFFIKGE